jgi:hypothetical protein
MDTPLTAYEMTVLISHMQLGTGDQVLRSYTTTIKTLVIIMHIKQVRNLRALARKTNLATSPAPLSKIHSMASTYHQSYIYFIFPTS